MNFTDENYKALYKLGYLALMNEFGKLCYETDEEEWASEDIDILDFVEEEYAKLCRILTKKLLDDIMNKDAKDIINTINISSIKAMKIFQ